MADLTSPLPPEGVEVDVRATFGGSGLFISKNNLNPSLKLFEDQVEIKVMKAASLRYEDIESVDVKKAWMTNNVSFAAAGIRRPLTANLRSAEDLAGVLEFLDGKGVPLTDRARKHLGD